MEHVDPKKAVLYAAYITCGLYIALVGMRFNVQHPSFIVSLVSEKASLFACYLVAFMVAQQWDMGLGMLIGVIVFLTYYDVQIVANALKE